MPGLHRPLVVALIFLAGPLVTFGSNLDSCRVMLQENLPIHEKILLDIPGRWPNRIEIDGEVRERFLRNAGYADSLGAVSSKIRAELLAQSPLTESRILQLIRVRGIDGTTDESIYMAVVEPTTIVSRTLIASLQATCESTLLRVCSTNDGLTIAIAQLRHDFNCEADEYVRTEILPAFSVQLGEDGGVTDVMDKEPIEQIHDEGE